MPTRFLSDAEIERLEGWPEAIERRDVVRYFAPAGDDLAFVREQRGAPNQLAVGLQLGALRWLGFVPEELAAAPPEAVAMLAGTLDLQPRAIYEYAVRAQTRGEHRLLVRAHAGFRPFTEREVELLGDRFVDGALEHERPSLLLGRLWETLRGERVERPSIDRMIRLVAWARERAHERTFERLRSQLTDQVRGKLDGLLLTEAGPVRPRVAAGPADDRERQGAGSRAREARVLDRRARR